MIGHTIGALTNCTHGQSLAAITLPYYRFIYRFGLQKFVRFASNVWQINPNHKTDEEIALEGLKALESFMKELGLTLSLKELGVTESMLERIAEKSFILDAGYKKLTKEEILTILKNSFNNA